MGIESDFSTGETAIIEIHPDTLPEGDGEFTPLPGLTLDMSSGETDLGYQATGTVSKDQRFVDSTAMLYIGGELAGSQQLTSIFYELIAPPPQILEGDTDGGGDTFVFVFTESGGIHRTDFPEGAKTVNEHVVFEEATVTVLDANGDPAPGERVIIEDTESVTTDSEGSALIETSGETSFTALMETTEKVVDITNEDEITFQYAGVEGSVQTPDGLPISNKTVEVLLTGPDGTNVLLNGVTDENGEFDLTKTPPNTSGLLIRAEPFMRSLDTRDEGEITTRNFPSPLLQHGDPNDPETVESDDLISITIDATDKEADEPISALQAEIGDFPIKTSPRGRAVGFVDRTQYPDGVPINLGENRRYRRQSLIFPAGEGGGDEIELERHINSTQV